LILTGTFSRIILKMFCTSKENTKCSSLSAAKVINSPVGPLSLIDASKALIPSLFVVFS
jgi:hypothetical protein